MAQKHTGPAKKAARAAYQAEDRARKNRERRLKRHFAKHPNDATAEKALKDPKGYTRKTPGTGKFANKASGIQVIGTDKKGKSTWGYVAAKAFAPGHPVYAIAKDAFPYSKLRLKDVAIIDPKLFK